MARSAYHRTWQNAGDGRCPSTIPETSTPRPTHRRRPRDRLLVFWEGGFATYTLPTSGKVAIGRLQECEICVDHPSVSRRHAELLLGPPLRVVDLGSFNGTRVGGVRITPNEPTLVPAAHASSRSGPPSSSSRRRHARRPRAARCVRPRCAGQDDGLVVADERMAQLHRLLRAVAQGTISVLLLGETGVGKEVIAQSIHRYSPRAARPFVSINCAAIPEALLESELFGHERGAFTGAVKEKAGLLETAEGGTLLLDEVGEMPLPAQAKLLRAIELRQIVRVGGVRPRPVDVRFVSATNRDLEQLIAARAFRRDLFFRLNGISVSVPPLRERLGELEGLARRFLAEFGASLGKANLTLSAEALATAARACVARERPRAAERDRARGAALRALDDRTRAPVARSRWVGRRGATRSRERGSVVRRRGRVGARGAVRRAPGHRAKANPRGTRTLRGQPDAGRGDARHHAARAHSPARVVRRAEAAQARGVRGIAAMPRTRWDHRRACPPSVVLAIAVAGACGGAKKAEGPPPAADGGNDPGPQLDVPVLEVADDAIRHWERWPYQRIGTRTYMRSTYDRTGGNEAADASHFLRESADYFVPFDVVGQGVLAFVRTNRWHGSPWHYVVDGDDAVVTETNTATPDNPVANATFLPQSAFPPPLALTESTTQGADVSWVPIPFSKSFQLGYERTDYGTGYYVFDLYPPGATNLSQALVPWTAQPPAADVVALVARAGQDIAPNDATVTTQTGQVDLAASATTPIVVLSGSSTIRALTFTVPLGEEQAFGAAHIRITWDDRPTASVDAPIALFFATGSLYNRSNATYLVQAFPVHVRFDTASVELATYFPMPFFRDARIEIVAQDAVPGVAWEVRTQPYADPPSWASYFHATYRDQGVPSAGQDLVMLDTTQTEGGGDWSGSLVGTSFVFSEQASLGTLEGDPRFFFDDSQTPQAQGTGSEEWGAGGDYWNGGVTTTLAFAGHPVGAPSAAAATSLEDEIESEYRFLLADAMPFGKNARVQIEHGGVDDSIEHYQTVAFWYGLPGASLVQTDALHVSDPVDEANHAYVSPDASGVDTLTSRYEWGIDHVGTAETYPATTDTGRHTKGMSQFTVAVQPTNYGVLLRRKLDYSYPDQRATVSVADDRDGAPFEDAGTWYLAGGSTVLFEDSSSETSNVGAPTVESSDHRWRDDEFIDPAAAHGGASGHPDTRDFRACEPAAPAGRGAAGAGVERVPVRRLLLGAAPVAMRGARSRARTSRRASRRRPARGGVCRVGDRRCETAVPASTRDRSRGEDVERVLGRDGNADADRRGISSGSRLGRAHCRLFAFPRVRSACSLNASSSPAQYASTSRSQRWSSLKRSGRSR